MAYTWEGFANAIGEMQAKDRARAQATADAASHHGTIAVLSACLRELRRLDPANPMHRRAVRDAIDAAGERAGSFQAAWRSDHDPAAILERLREARRETVAALLPEVEAEDIRSRLGGFLWLSRRWVWWGNTYKKLEHAERARAHVLGSLRSDDVDEPIDERALKLAAWRAIGL